MVWALAMAWMYLAMSSMSEPVLPLPIYFALSFGPPGLLIISSIVVFVRHSRVAAIGCIAASTLLTCWLVPNWISMFLYLFRTPEPLQSPITAVNYLIVFGIAAFVISVDVAAVILLRSVTKPSID